MRLWGASSERSPPEVSTDRGRQGRSLEEAWEDQEFCKAVVVFLSLFPSLISMYLQGKQGADTSSEEE